MGFKIATFSDLHCRNLKYHDEYRQVAAQLYEKLREERPDFIVFCGDFFHSKTVLSPESVELGSEIIKNLSVIAPLYLTLGQHDGLIKNKERQDALTPIVDSLNLPNVKLLKMSGEYEANDDITLCVLSIYDQENWNFTPKDKDKINIALFHGIVGNAATDLGHNLTEDISLSAFENFDFGFFGDVHASNQVLDINGKFRYCGSTIQQNFGEEDNKGFLIWEIKSKDDFTCRHITIPAPRPFVTVEVDKSLTLPADFFVKPGSRVRVKTDYNFPPSMIRTLLDTIRSRFQPESVVYFSSRAKELDSEGNTVLLDALVKENVRDINVQERFIRRHLKEISEDQIEKVLELNKKYSISEDDGEVGRNIKWKLEEVQWDNLFNYSEGNKIDFTKLHGVVGILGKNYTGKSSVIDSALYTLFNSISKPIRKNLDIINQNKTFGRGKVKIRIGEDVYYIERESEKYIKKLYGAETIEAKTDVKFYSVDSADKHKNYHGESRTETDANIRRVFGTCDDFLLTAMTSQLDSMSFLKEGSTKRKEILARFLDLDIFEKKFKMAKEDSAELKAELKYLESVDYEEDFKANKELLRDNESAIESAKQEQESLKTSLSLLFEAQDKLKKELSTLIVDVDIELAQEKLNERNKMKDILLGNIKDCNFIINTCQEKLSRIEALDDMFDLEENKKIILTGQEKGRQVEVTERVIDDLGRELQINKNKTQLLSEVPCGSMFKECKFKKDAYCSLSQIPNIEQQMVKEKQTKENVETEIQALNVDKVKTRIEKYESAQSRRHAIEITASENQLNLYKTQTDLAKINVEIEAQQNVVEEYNKNKAIVDEKKSLQEKFDLNKVEDDRIKATLDQINNRMVELYKQHGQYSGNIAQLGEKKVLLQQKREEFVAYDLFLRCMHVNGVANDIIKDKIHNINNEIGKILANVVEFEVLLASEDGKLEVLIKHPKYEPRYIEAGSGAEKMLASMAIRLAFINVSSLPVPNIFVLDEPAGALDQDNLDGFVKLLTVVKEYFDIVILITHLEELKDVVEQQIVIEKKEGYAHVEV